MTHVWLECQSGEVRRTSRPWVAGEVAPVALPANLQRVSSAFELPFMAVLEDVALVRRWQRSAAELLDMLRERHEWDASVAPYYLRWLLKLSQTPQA
jgi:hypothetical protein